MASTSTLTVRQAPEGVEVMTFEFPADTEGHGIVRYVITRKPALRRGGPERFSVYLVLVADGLCVNDNLPVASYDNLFDAMVRSRV